MILLWRFLFLALIFTPYRHTLASSSERAATQEENDVFNGISSEEEDYKDECTECQEKTKEKLEQALIIKIIDESKFKESNTPNVLDLLKALSILVSDTNNKGAKEIIIQIKNGQNHLNKRFNYVLNSHDKRAKRQANDLVNTNEIIPDNKRDHLVNNENIAPNSASATNEGQNNLNTDQVSTNDAITEGNSNSVANQVQNKAKTDVSYSDESAINNENGKQNIPNTFTQSTYLEDNPTNDIKKVSDDANLQNANVDNFQDDNFINSNDSSTNDTATATVDFDNQNSQNVSLVIKEGNYNVSYNSNNNETSNKNQIASSNNQSFNDEANYTNDKLNSLTENDNDNDFAFNNSETLQNEPIGRSASVENVFNETVSAMNRENFATENIIRHLENTFNNEQDEAFNKSLYGNKNDNFDETDASESYNTTARIPLSSNQLSNLQNVLKENFGVNNHDSRPVANFHLNKSEPDDKPVIVIVYNCSCNKNSANIQNQSKIKEEPTIDENGGNFGLMSAGQFHNTRRMMHDDSNLEDNNPPNNVIKKENTTSSSQSYENTINTDINKVKSDKSNKVETKQTAASIENNLLIKCKSLLAVEAENAENFAKNRRYDDTSIKQENTNKEQVKGVKDKGEPNGVTESNHANVTSSSENDLDTSSDTSGSDVATNNNNVHRLVDFLSNLSESHNEDNNGSSQNEVVNSTSQANNENEFSAVITTNNNDEVNNNTELGAGDSSTNTDNVMNNNRSNDSNQQFNSTSENTYNSPGVNDNDYNNTDNSTFVPESNNNTESSNLVTNNTSLEVQNDSNNTGNNNNLVTDNEIQLQNDNGESSVTSNLVSNIQNTEFSTESSSKSQIDNKVLNSETSAQDVLRKRRNIEKDVEKRDVLSNINDALKNILQLPSHGLDLISSTFETDDNTYNRSLREVITNINQADDGLPIEDSLLKFLNYNTNKNNFHFKDSDENGVYKKDSKEYFNSFNGDSTKEGNDGSNKMLTKLIKLLRPIEINVYLDVN